MDAKAEKLALFRYGVIASLVIETLPRGELTRRAQEIAARHYDIPDSKRTSVSVDTLLDWAGRYRHGGFEALAPKPRQDRGSPAPSPRNWPASANASNAKTPHRTGTTLLRELACLPASTHPPSRLPRCIASSNNAASRSDNCSHPRRTRSLKPSSATRSGRPILVIHSRPYQPEGRGKIERFFRTSREQFLANLVPKHPLSLDELNDRLSGSGSKMSIAVPNIALWEPTPLLRWQRDIEQVRQSPPFTDLRRLFFHRLDRLVRRDSTFLLNKLLYEAPPHLAGHTVEVRFDPLDTAQVEIWFQGKLEATARPDGQQSVDFRQIGHLARAGTHWHQLRRAAQTENEDGRTRSSDHAGSFLRL
jgi:hypothetical protein